LIDPIDLVLVGRAAFNLSRKGIANLLRPSSRVATGMTGRLLAAQVSTEIVGAMRATFKGLSARKLKFTATTLERMAVETRFVPVHILHLAIKYGKRGPDPQGVKNAFMYTIKMMRKGKEYDLEVLVRESDWTILHFVYR
jgi:hypothetical protein